MFNTGLTTYNLCPAVSNESKAQASVT